MLVVSFFSLEKPYVQYSFLAGIFSILNNSLCVQCHMYRLHAAWDKWKRGRSETEGDDDVHEDLEALCVVTDRSLDCEKMCFFRLTEVRK